MNADQFASHLTEQGWKVRRQGSGYRCQCPAHGGQDLNLAVGAGANGGVVVSCKSHKCTADAITGAVGLTVKDLMPAALNGQLPHVPAAVYPYRDEQGIVLFEKVREARKQFWCRLPGQTKGGIGNVRRVLFGLPELLKTAPGDLVAICEGEKDAINVARLGIAATTNFEGAEVWLPEYTEWLKERLPGRRFVILPDNDPPGQKHALRVAEALSAAGLEWVTVKLPGLPDKGDVSDWIEAGGTAEQLRALAAPPPPRFRLLTLDELCALPPPVWQVENLFEEQTLIEWFGMTTHAKSLVLLDLALSITRGGAWCGRRIIKPGPVVWVNADGGRGITKRAKAWKEAHGGEFRYPFLTFMGSVRLNQHDEVSEFLKQLQGLPEAPVLIVFDTLSRCIPGTDENLQGPMTLVTDECHRLKLELGSTVGLIHHTDKTGDRDRGSSVVKNEADYVMRVFKDRPSGIITVSSEKAREGDHFEDFYLRLMPVGDSVVVVQTDAGPETEAPVRKDVRQRDANEEAVVEIIAAAEAKARAARDEGLRADYQHIWAEVERLEIAEATLQRYLRRLVQSERVSAWNRPVLGHPKRFVYGVLCRSEEDCIF